MQKKTIKKTYFKKKHILFYVVVWLCIVALFNTIKPLPQDISYESETFRVNEDSVEFLYDLTYQTKNGDMIYEQEIFDEVFDMINHAKDYILVDMFLYNDFQGAKKLEFRNLSYELTQKLINKKKKRASIDIIVITDPINNVYGGAENSQLELLEENGINVIITNLNKLRDSNVLYSPFYRTFLQWFGNSEGGFMSHPFSSEGNDVSIRSYLRLANFKANHRKIISCDDGDGSYVSLITSANPHDGSAAHSNIAFKISEDIHKSIYESEMAVVEFSDDKKLKYDFNNNFNDDNNIQDDENSLQIQLITESKILKSVVEAIKNTSKDDEIKLGMFYLSERNIINALIDAANRGVEVEIILDPNKDAFGYDKGGIPNRQVAYELLNKSKNKIKIRWYDTHGEQFHTKILYIKKDNGQAIVILGSANYTRRNLKNYNLETNIKVTGHYSQNLFVDIDEYFERIWFNDNDNYTVDYNVYKDESLSKRILYRIQEFIGTCTF